MTPIQAIVFLGNPGREYEKTRHNAGFQLADRWPALQDVVWQKKFKGLWGSSLVQGRKIHLLKPETFMNASGESARALGEFFRIPPEAWLVVHDDIDLPFGEVRLQAGGGLGGHNGLRSLKQHSGTNEFQRLRLGVGRPTRGDVASFVLARFEPDEQGEWERTLDRAVQVVERALENQTP